MRPMTAKHLSSIAAALVLAAPGAFAQTQQERQWCESETGVTADQRIDGCSAVIKAGREKGDKLAEVFNNRGVAYRVKGDHERAIQDYGQAIKLNTKFAAAYINRGVAYDHKGDYDRAIADYEQALKLKPSAEGHFNRGNAHLAKREYDRAIDDYNQAIKLKADFAAAFDNRCWARAVVGILKPALADCNAGAPTDAEECRNAGQPRLRLSENVAVRCRRLRLRRGLADQSEAGLRALRPRLGEIEERGHLRRERRRGRQGAAS